MSQPEMTAGGPAAPPQPGVVIPADHTRPVLVIYRGLPGCGKTTHAIQALNRLRESGFRTARLSRDDVRRTLGLVAGRTTTIDEAEVTAAHAAMLRALLGIGVQVLLADDTNLLDERAGHLARLAASAGAQHQVIDLRDVPASVCIARDATRTGTAHVGAVRIRELARTAGLH